jgi:pantetheine-phosphate adenylyltransferase
MTENLIDQIQNFVDGIFSTNDSVLIMRTFNKYMKDRVGYHGPKHIFDVLQTAQTFIKNHSQSISNMQTRYIYLSIMYHDIYYVPMDKDNEAKSASIFFNDSSKLECLTSKDDIKSQIVKAIEKTTHHTNPRNLIEEILFDSDLYRIRNNTFPEYCEDELLLREEFTEYVPLNYYLDGRVEFMEKFLRSHVDEIKHLGEFKKYINFLRDKSGSIAVYPGSFNPVHVGHMDIAKKCLKMYDQVIMLVSINPDKIGMEDAQSELELRCDKIRKLGRRSGISICAIPNYDLTSIFMKNMDKSNKRCNYVLVRGLRDGYDLDHELKQERFMREIYPDLNVIYISGDPKHSHISSSAIRALEKMNAGKKNPAIAKIIKTYS